MFSIGQKVLGFISGSTLSSDPKNNIDRPSLEDYISVSDIEREEFDGIVTTVDKGHVVVNDNIYFSILFSQSKEKFKVGDQVQGIAERKTKHEAWNAVNLSHSQGDTEWDSKTPEFEGQAISSRDLDAGIPGILKKDLFSPNGSRQLNLINTRGNQAEHVNRAAADGTQSTIIGRVEMLLNDDVTLNQNSYFRLSEANASFDIAKGDWIVCKLNHDTKNDEDLFSGFLNVVQVDPVRKKKINGEVTHVYPLYLVINREIYCPRRLNKEAQSLRRGDPVFAEIVESDQEQQFCWRAISLSIEASNEIQDLRLDTANRLRGFDHEGIHAHKLLQENKHGITISHSIRFPQVFIGCTSNQTVSIVNSGEQSRSLVRAYFVSASVDSQFVVAGESSEYVVNDKPVEILSTKSLSVKLSCTGKLLGESRQLCIFDFGDFQIGRYVTANVQDRHMLNLYQTGPYSRIGRREFKNFEPQDSRVIKGEKPFRAPAFLPLSLPAYHVPSHLWDAVESKEKVLMQAPFLEDPLTEENYQDKYSCLLHLEEVEMTIQMREFDMTRTTFSKAGEYLSLTVPGLAEKRPSLMIGDTVITSNPCNLGGTEYEGYIHEVLHTQVLLKFHPSFHEQYRGEDYAVRFNFNRTPLRRCHFALQFSKQQLGSEVLFPTKLKFQLPQVCYVDPETFSLNAKRNFINAQNNVRKMNRFDNQKDFSIRDCIDYQRNINKNDCNNLQKVSATCKMNSIDTQENESRINSIDTQEKDRKKISVDTRQNIVAKYNLGISEDRNTYIDVVTNDTYSCRNAKENDAINFDKICSKPAVDDSFNHVTERSNDRKDIALNFRKWKEEKNTLSKKGEEIVIMENRVVSEEEDISEMKNSLVLKDKMAEMKNSLVSKEQKMAEMKNGLVSNDQYSKSKEVQVENLNDSVINTRMSATPPSIAKITQKKSVVSPPRVPVITRLFGVPSSGSSTNSSICCSDDESKINSETPSKNTILPLKLSRENESKSIGEMVSKITNMNSGDNESKIIRETPSKNICSLKHNSENELKSIGEMVSKIKNSSVIESDRQIYNLSDKFYSKPVDSIMVVTKKENFREQLKSSDSNSCVFSLERQFQINTDKQYMADKSKCILDDSDQCQIEHYASTCDSRDSNYNLKDFKHDPCKYDSDILIPDRNDKNLSKRKTSISDVEANVNNCDLNKDSINNSHGMNIKVRNSVEKDFHMKHLEEKFDQLFGNGYQSKDNLKDGTNCADHQERNPTHMSVKMINQSINKQGFGDKRDPCWSLNDRVGPRNQTNYCVPVLPLKTSIDEKIKNEAIPVLKWFDKNLNLEQKMAVRRILEGSTRPLPYVIYGPPGTGKTITIVESILQIFTLVHHSRLLIVTPSNSAADLVTDRLLKFDHLQKADLVRLNAYQRKEESIPSNILPYCCNGDDLTIGVHQRIVITTATTAGVLYTLGLHNGHFTHVLVDEAGQLTVPETLVALGLINSASGQMVLAGDPQQLGPVVQSRLAKHLGLQDSFLHHLCNTVLYQPEKVNESSAWIYEPRLTTRLVKNYRSHPDIISVPSKLFYHDALEPLASLEVKEKLLQWDDLPNAHCPVLFHGLVSDNLQEGDSPSWFNPAEAFQVVRYSKSLVNFGVEASNIGIITPYRKQVQKIRQLLETFGIQDGIKVGTVEEFQGQERVVIIISTVRSSEHLINVDVQHSLGFVRCRRRFNVAITRAQSLLVVVGNPLLLMLDDCWLTFISFCIGRGAYRGPELQFPD